MYRYRLPPWRDFAPVFDEDGGSFLLGIVLGILSAIFIVVMNVQESTRRR